MSEASCRKCGSPQSGKFCDQCGAAMPRHWSSAAELRRAVEGNDTEALKAMRDVLASTPTKELETRKISLEMFYALQAGRVSPGQIPDAVFDLVASKQAENREKQTEFAKAFTTKPSVAKPNDVSRRRFHVIEPPSARWYRQFAASENPTGRKVNR